MGLALFRIKPVEQLTIDSLTSAQESYKTANTVEPYILHDIIEGINKRTKLGYYDYRYDGNIPPGVIYQLTNKNKNYSVVENYEIDGFRDPDDSDTARYKYYYDIYWDFTKDEIKTPEDH